MGNRKRYAKFQENFFGYNEIKSVFFTFSQTTYILVQITALFKTYANRITVLTFEYN